MVNIIPPMFALSQQALKVQDLDTWQIPNPAHHLAVPIAQATTQVIADIRIIPIYGLFFKCIVWLMFISVGSGAETRRAWLLRDLWLEPRSENIANAVGVLEKIWYRADREEEEAEAGKGEKVSRD
ncbi:hypothetical protein ACLOAV_005800 [Pseudogymnoascus australis]